jgi:hypothetical protein
MKVFISYGSSSDQVTALRLQALGAVNGLTIYVPPAYTRQLPYASIDPEAAQQLKETDFILGIVGFSDSPACREELQAGRSLGKRTMLMTEESAAPYFRTNFSQNLVVVNSANPYQTELEIVQHLKSLNAGQQANKALVALGTLALGLLIFTLAGASED